MQNWTVDTPTTLDFDGVAALRVRVVSGSVAVLSTDDKPRLDVAGLAGQPLLVKHEAGILTITYPDLTWDGMLGWLRPQPHSATITVMVPPECPTQLGVVSASAVISGINATTSVKSVSGKITLDGVTGAVDAITLSGDMEAQGVDGQVGFNSVSGDLTMADGAIEKLEAKTVSGHVTDSVFDRYSIGTEKQQRAALCAVSTTPRSSQGRPLLWLYAAPRPIDACSSID